MCRLLSISTQAGNDLACPQGDGILESSITILATKPFGDDPRWNSMEPDELCAVINGVVDFPSGSAATNDEPGHLHKEK